MNNDFDIEDLKENSTKPLYIKEETEIIKLLLTFLIDCYIQAKPGDNIDTFLYDIRMDVIKHIVTPYLEPNMPEDLPSEPTIKTILKEIIRKENPGITLGHLISRCSERLKSLSEEELNTLKEQVKDRIPSFHEDFQHKKEALITYFKDFQS